MPLPSLPSQTRRPALVAALSIVSAVVLAACGSSSSSSSSGAGSAGAGAGSSSSSSSSGSFFTTVQKTDAATVAGVTTDASARAMLPAALKSSGSLTIGTQNSAPETFYAPGTSTLIGDEVTLMKAISKTLGLTPKFDVVQFDELIPGLQSKRFGVTIGAMNDTKKRQATISFVDYFNAGIGIVVKKGNPKHITGPSSLCGVAVNVQLGTTQEALAKSQSSTCTSEGKKPVTIIYAQSNAQQQAELQSGRVDVYLADTPTAAYVAAQHPDLFEQADANNAIEAAPYGIGFNKSDSGLGSAVQAALNHLIKSGAYGKILTAWGLQSGAVKQATLNGGQ